MFAELLYLGASIIGPALLAPPTYDQDEFEANKSQAHQKSGLVQDLALRRQNAQAIAMDYAGAGWAGRYSSGILKRFSELQLAEDAAANTYAAAVTPTRGLVSNMQQVGRMAQQF